MHVSYNECILELLLFRRSCHEEVHLKRIEKNVKMQFLLKSAMYARIGNCYLTYEYTFDQKYGSSRLNSLYLHLHIHTQCNYKQNKHPKRLPTQHPNLFLVNSQQTPYLIPPQYHQYLCLLQSCPMNINLKS